MEDRISGAAGIGARSVDDEEPFALELGGALPRLEIAYESWGTLSPAADNAILVCPSFSADSHAHSHAGDPSPGWWEGMIGPGGALDSDRFFLLCPSLLGGTSGTTGTLSQDPRSGRPYGAGFPVITVRDLVAAHLRLLDHLGIDRLHAALGGSLGGMEAIELAVRHPRRVAKVFAISATDRTRPFTAAIRHVGRRAIQLDPEYRGGRYEGLGPKTGLRLARELGTLFYRSRLEINNRFDWDPIREPEIGGTVFEIQSYLEHQGNKAVGRFDANSYLTLSLAMDLHDVWRGFESQEEALEEVSAEFLVAGVKEDHLIPVDEQRDFHDCLRGAGKRSTWKRISNPVGHDTFLADIGLMVDLVGEFLA